MTDPDLKSCSLKTFLQMGPTLQVFDIIWTIPDVLSLLVITDSSIKSPILSSLFQASVIFGCYLFDYYQWFLPPFPHLTFFANSFLFAKLEESGNLLVDLALEYDDSALRSLVSVIGFTDLRNVLFNCYLQSWCIQIRSYSFSLAAYHQSEFHFIWASWHALLCKSGDFGAAIYSFSFNCFYSQSLDDSPSLTHSLAWILWRS